MSSLAKSLVVSCFIVALSTTFADTASATNHHGSRCHVKSVHRIKARPFGRHGITAMQRERFLVKSCTR